MFFESINLKIPEAAVYQRLGYAKGITELDEKQRARITSYFEEAETLMSLKGAAVRLRVISNTGEGISLSDGIVFESANLAKMLSGCDEVLLIAATAGADIVAAIDDDAKTDNLSRAVVLDAVASETVDECLSWIMGYYNTDLRREGLSVLRKRFSAGYGDLSLDNQAIIYKQLDLGKIGVRITESFMLVPEKSVTAVCGIKKID